MNEQSTKLPTSFWVISALALVWNLIGVMAFISQSNMSEETLAAMPEAERALVEAFPGWMMVVYGIAVFAGALGCVALLLRKAWAVPLLLTSLVAVLIQMTYSIFLSGALQVYGATYLIMPVLLIAISVFLVYYARNSRTKGWLT